MLVTTSFSVINVAGTEISEENNLMILSDNSYTDHDDIIIDGNDDFLRSIDESGVSEGDGSEINPYVIKNWKVYEIIIDNTDVHFRISDCDVKQIIFTNVDNGDILSCTFLDDTQYGNRRTIYLEYCNNCEIIGCTIENPECGGGFDQGILIRASNNNMVSDCTIFDNNGGYEEGIIIDYDTHDIIGSNNNVVKNCHVSNVDIGFKGLMRKDNPQIINYLDSNTFVNCSNVFLVTGYECRNNNFILTDIRSGSPIRGDKNYWNKNYYSDYTGRDEDNDDIGDTKYEIKNYYDIDYNPRMISYGHTSDSPTDPTVDGPTNVKKGKIYDYSARSTDTDGKIRYCFDWGDGSETWTEYYDSDEMVTVNHIWTKQGTYQVKVISKDHYGYESSWTYLEVTVPKNKPKIIETQLSRFLESHPLIYQLIQLIQRLPAFQELI